jgi:3-oxoacyl-[acyl-carrier protein] reductase
MKTLNGRIAIVCGATGGVGAPVAKRLYKEGMVVVLSARNKDNLQNLADELGNERVHIFPSDVSEMSDVVKLFDFAKKIGDIELVVSAVGTWRPLNLTASSEEANEVYRSQSKMFLDSAQNLGHIAVQTMQTQENGGTFVHFSSHAATKILPGNLAYASAKAGARALILNLNGELKKEGVSNVRVSDVQPAAMLTESMRKVVPEKDWDKLISMEEITDLVVKIAISENPDLEYPVDGGYSF